MSRSDTEVLQELKDAKGTNRNSNDMMKSYHALVIDLEPQPDPYLIRHWMNILESLSGGFKWDTQVALK